MRVTEDMAVVIASGAKQSLFFRCWDCHGHIMWPRNDNSSSHMQKKLYS